jgi:hypothetical protein
MSIHWELDGVDRRVGVRTASCSAARQAAGYSSGTSDTDHLTTITTQGETLTYTRPERSLFYFDFETFAAEATQLEPSPFTQILAISNGMCGSTDEERRCLTSGQHF